MLESHLHTSYQKVLKCWYLLELVHVHNLSNVTQSWHPNICMDKLANIVVLHRTSACMKNRMRRATGGCEGRKHLAWVLPIQLRSESPITSCSKTSRINEQEGCRDVENHRWFSQQLVVANAQLLTSKATSAQENILGDACTCDTYASGNICIGSRKVTPLSRERTPESSVASMHWPTLAPSSMGDMSEPWVSAWDLFTLSSSWSGNPCSVFKLWSGGI